MSINPGFRLIKILDIGYVTIIYFLLAIIIAVLLNKIYGEYNEKDEKKKSTFRKSLDVVGMIWINGIIMYIVRNLVPLIPSPFNNIYGFKHARLKELESAYVFDFVLIYTQTNLVKRMGVFFDTVKMYLFK
uniref:Uncharacterized protein n=1 Tax=viral metagenome TaxID=1070528 RepID=A0A6C0IJU7_9ZZZZ